MDNTSHRDRWANRFAWLMVALIAWTANWWISGFIPVTPVALFATTMILVSLMYALALGGMDRILRKDIRTWTLLPRFVRENVIVGLAVLLATVIFINSVREGKSLTFEATSATATFIGLFMATWWREIFATAKRRAAGAIAELHRNVRGHPH